MAARKHIWMGFRVLCLLSGSGWILDQWRPGVLTGLLQVGVHDGVLALLFWGADFLRGGSRGRLKTELLLAAWGVALLAVPAVVIAGAGGRVSSLTEVLVFGLVPVVVVFVVAQRASGFGLGESPLHTMGPALAGLGGLALLVPFSVPGSATGIAWLAGIVVSAGVAGLAAVRLHGLMVRTGLLRGAAVVCGAATLVLLGCCRVDWSGLGEVSASSVAVEVGRCLLVDGPVLLLTVWLAREMRPVSFAARYLLIPLVTIAEGFLLVRPEWNWTMGAGFLLLGGGCGWLLWSDSGEVPEGL